MTDALEKRLQDLEDGEAIRRLKAEYCRYADDPERGEDFAALFTDDAILDEGDDLVIVCGRANIARLHTVMWRYLEMNQHFVFSPLIDVDGDNATGYWQLLQISTVAEAGRDPAAFWSCGWYDEKYLRTAAGWRIAEVVARVHFCAPYADGWANTPFGEFLSADALGAIQREITGDTDGT